MVHAVGSQPPMSYGCWADGTKAITVTTSSTVMVMSTTSVRGSDLCYSVERTDTIPATTIDYVWKKVNGTMVAHGTADAATPSRLTIICNGLTYTVDLSSAVCQGQVAVPTCATSGNCSL